MSAPLGEQGSSSEAELVTVMIPVRNEEKFIEACLASVTAQTYTNLEILVVDGNSTDGTVAVVAECSLRDPRIALLHNPHSIVPSSLNIAARAARGKWLVRVDAHATVPADYVERAINHLRTGRWGGVGGRVDAIGETPAGKAIAAAMGSRFGIGNSVHHYGRQPVPADHVPFPAYSTEVVRQLGGWDERLVVNQDFEFDYRLGRSGYRLLYDPELAIAYHCRQSVRAVWRQFRRYGCGKARVIGLHPRSARPRHFAAPCLVAWMAAAGLSAVRRPRLAALACAPYVVGVVVASSVVARQLPDRRASARVPAVFAAMHLAWGFGFWQGVAQITIGLFRGSGTLRPFVDTPLRPAHPTAI